MTTKIMALTDALGNLIDRLRLGHVVDVRFEHRLHPWVQERDLAAGGHQPHPIR